MKSQDKCAALVLLDRLPILHDVVWERDSEAPEDRRPPLGAQFVLVPPEEDHVWMVWGNGDMVVAAEQLPSICSVLLEKVNREAVIDTPKLGDILKLFVGHGAQRLGEVRCDQECFAAVAVAAAIVSGDDEELTTLELQGIELRALVLPRRELLWEKDPRFSLRVERFEVDTAVLILEDPMFVEARLVIDVQDRGPIAAHS